MSRALALFAIGLVFGGGIGFVVAAGNGVTFDGNDHAETSTNAGVDHGMMHDTPIEVSAVNAPEVAIEVIPDPMDGYNLRVRTRNFTFAPASASLADVTGEGHAHVSINGKKLARVYGEWMHLTGLPKGEVMIDVTLNSNDHSPLAVAGQTISASTMVIVE